MLKRTAVICILCLGTGLAQAKQLLDKVVAVVNNSVITARELDTQVNASRKQLLAQKKELPNVKVMRKQVLQHLIDVDLQMQLAKQNNVTVEGAELDEAIGRIAEANHITVAKLQEELTKQGMNWHEYRDNIQKEMVLARIQQKAIGKDVTVTNEQIEHYLKTTGLPPSPDATYHLQHIVVPLNDNPTAQEVKKAETSAIQILSKIKKGEDFGRIASDHFIGEYVVGGGDLGERHLAELPEIFAKEASQMHVGQIVGPIRAGNGFQLLKLLAVKGDNQKHIISQTHVRHILLKPDAGMLPEESIKYADNIYQQLKAGKDFAAMAKKYSLDTASAVKGGDLGWVNSGELVPPFEKAMGSLAINQISHPVKTQFGWHIIQVLERKQKDDSDAFKKQQVRQILQQRKFMEAVESWQQHLRAEAYVNIVEKDLA
jgi:peptidyl-prolyl cis-trans isomerase SurA